jgi:hypothetical protein
MNGRDYFDAKKKRLSLLSKDGDLPKFLQPTAANRVQPPGITKGKSHPTPPSVYRPQPVPKCLQRKTLGAQQRPPAKSNHPPVAPPAYRPQSEPKVLQAKDPVSRRQVNPSSRVPTAPPGHRPQPAAQVLQRKTAQSPAPHWRPQPGTSKSNPAHLQFVKSIRPREAADHSHPQVDGSRLLQPMRMSQGHSGSPPPQTLRRLSGVVKTPGRRANAVQRMMSSLGQPTSTLALGSYQIQNDADFSNIDLVWFATHLKMNATDVTASFTWIGSSTNNYNCHAWSLGFSNNTNSPQGQTVDDFDTFYSPYGFARVNDISQARIAVYGPKRTKLDHVAVKYLGKWTSKLGGGPLVVHKNGLEDLEGETKYGSVQFYYGWKISTATDL